MRKEEKEAAVRQVPFWYHSIDVGDGVITPGRLDLQGMQAKWSALHVPALEGRSVLDIGAWDGYFSFEAERNGAARVVALDKYVYEQDLARAPEVARKLIDAGTVDMKRIPNFYLPDKMPTKRGFDLAHRLLDSRVELVLDDLVTVDPVALGSFDIVFYLGGLYHMADPLGALRKVALLTRGTALIETAGIEIPNVGSPLFEFYAAKELNNDPSNWWAPNPAGLIAMCKAAGFKDAKIVAPVGVTAVDEIKRLRIFAHAWH